MLGGNETVFRLWLIILHYWIKILLYPLLEAPWVLIVSSPISGVDIATSNLVSRFFPCSCLLSSHEHTYQCSFEYLRMPLSGFLELFLCAPLSSLVLCLVHSSHLDLHILSALLPQLRRFSRLCQWPGLYKL